VHLKHLIVFLPIVQVEGVILRFISQIVIAEAMFETGHHRLKILYMAVLLLAIGLVMSGYLLGVHKDVGDLLAHLTVEVYCYHCVTFCFEEGFAFAYLEEDYLCQLDVEEYFMVDTREKLVELFNLLDVYFEHGARLLEKLLPLLLHLIVLQTDIAPTILTLLRRIQSIDNDLLKREYPSASVVGGQAFLSLHGFIYKIRFIVMVGFDLWCDAISYEIALMANKGRGNKMYRLFRCNEMYSLSCFTITSVNSCLLCP
jgi:hypothetical protein